MALSGLQKIRSNYAPQLLPALQGSRIRLIRADPTTNAYPSDAVAIGRSFPHTYGQPLVQLQREETNGQSPKLSSASVGGPKNLAAVLPHAKRLLSGRGTFFLWIRPQFSASVRKSSPVNSTAPAEHSESAEKTLSSVGSPLPEDGRFKPNTPTLIAIGVAALGMAVLMVILKRTNRAGGSVEDLVKRGQLRSDRRSNSRPLKYEDPFNNPMVKLSERNSVVKMYGKAFRLEPVTLTEEKMLGHQNRRVQAYQWKRPTVFLVEGEDIPDGVDPDTVRWIPPNHPFATARNDFDEVAAEKNVYQTRGVPSRVRAEHEALRKRMMEAAEKESEVRTPTFDFSSREEKTRFDGPFPASLDQPDSGFGSRPIKPFEKPHG